MVNPQVMSGNLRLKLDDKTIFHAIDCSLTLSREFKERATKDTTGTERAKGIKSWTASNNGLVTYKAGTGTHNFAALFDLYDSDSETPIDVEFYPSEADADFYYAGEGYIESLEGTWTNNEDGTISLSIIGSGAMEKKTIPGG